MDKNIDFNLTNNLSFRKRQEIREHEILCNYAAFSDESLGRDRIENECDLRTIYQRDRDRIIHSKSFRRLKHKTQVFLAPEGDHYRTRLTHTLEVSQIARTIAKTLRLNEDLTEAIALAHDLGHTPFGHAGERALNRICPGGFKHSIQSLRVVKLIEDNGKGLNLTKEVKDGIANHQTKGNPRTLEGKVVRLADKIAYINHDIDDAIRGHIIKEEDIPTEYTSILGLTVKERLNRLIHDIVSNSDGKNDIIMSSEISEAMYGLREFMFENVYLNKKAKDQEEKAELLLEELFIYYSKNIDELPVDYRQRIRDNEDKAHRVICDYVAGMTDRYAVAVYKDLKIPFSWNVF